LKQGTISYYNIEKILATDVRVLVAEVDRVIIGSGYEVATANHYLNHDSYAFRFYVY
jgi:hypothetical protein